MKAALGLDTSCYVTSAAVVGEAGDVLYNGREPLPVEIGGLGLRQSEAFFLHMRRLPTLIDEAFAVLRAAGHTLCAIGVSAAPREAEDSYMPVFAAGLRTAMILGSAGNVPVHSFSHQQGHLRAAEIGQTGLDQRMIGIHLSGGTTEVLDVSRRDHTAKVLGGTQDISAGQWIDRIGVLLGCPFPAGPAMQALAQSGKPGQKAIGIPVRQGWMSFSGAEAEVKRRLQGGADAADLALEMFYSLARALCKALVYAHEATGLRQALIVGGVAANTIVREQVAASMKKRCGALEVFFADPAYAGDNAAGTALLAMSVATGQRIAKEENDAR